MPPSQDRVLRRSGGNVLMSSPEDHQFDSEKTAKNRVQRRSVVKTLRSKAGAKMA